ncbi:hypothetical protein MKX03_016079 [Papaver bracteatum]|nr:hypothetical protein MKX03_016079 [Papaver bracteatum]
MANLSKINGNFTYPFIKYIKEVWSFQKKPILVVLDPQGRVFILNALHMMWIWGSLAFPFTSMREEALWKEESWRLEVLKIHYHIKKCGTGSTNSLRTSKLIHCWQDLTLIWFFWVRLESMWYSNMQHGMTVENDTIMQEIMTMLSFDGSDQGWDVISSESVHDIAKVKGETILTAFTEYDACKEHVEPKGFVPALTDHLHQLHTPHHCNHLILPGTSGSIPEMVFCAECCLPMEKYTMYLCCTD